jgi:uncharacterized protein YjbJ (UPF0337 family)
MTRDQLRGALMKAAGTVQETTGKLIGSQQQRLKGLRRQVAGCRQMVVGVGRKSAKGSADPEHRSAPG